MESPVHRYGEGVLLYEPLYSYIENLADIVSTYRDLPISISLKGASLSLR